MTNDERDTLESIHSTLQVVYSAIAVKLTRFQVSAFKRSLDAMERLYSDLPAETLDELQGPR